MSLVCPKCSHEWSFTNPAVQAHEELRVEKYRQDVEHEKEKLKAKKPLFPWRLSIVRIK